MRFILAALLLVGCEAAEIPTADELCIEYSAEYISLQTCDDAYDCRLTDRESQRLHTSAILAVKYCQISMYYKGGDTDTDVQPPEEDEKEDTDA